MKADHNKLQAKVFQYHWNTYPQYRRTMWMNLNNAPNAKLGSQYKALGMVSGIPDISLIAPSGKFIGIEFKVGRDKQSQSQIDAQNALLSVNAEYHIISTFEEFTELLERIYAQ